MVSSLFTQTIYITVFGVTALVCVVASMRAHTIKDRDTRVGLRALLLLSALWAGAQTVRLLASEQWIATASYTIGLVVGLATVGAWLYFCSAYAGRSYHRKSLYRRLAIAVYIPIVGFKLTNSWHGMYFEATTVLTPFRHTAIQEQVFFWIIAGLAYLLSAFGFYILLDVFEQSRVASRAAKAVVVLAALPVVFDIAGYLLPPPILALNYESIGVGLFAIGALYVVHEPFFAVSRYGRIQLIDKIDDAVLILDVNEQIQDYNTAALDLFPTLVENETVYVDDISDEISTRVLSGGGTVELKRNGETRYFIITSTPLTVGATDIGYGVVCTDVTEIERHRRELQRKDEQLEGFATAVTHELRNSVGIVSGQAELASRLATENGVPELESRIETIIEETADMEQIVEELQTLARYSQTISETGFVELNEVVRLAKRRADVANFDLAVDDSIEVRSNQERLQELFRQLFIFASHNDASKVTVRGRSDGFSIEDNGRSLSTFDEADIFAYGNAVPDQSTAMTLANVQMLATGQGWNISIDSNYHNGVRININNVTTRT